MGRRSRSRLPPEPLELEITGLSHDGRGVASLDGKKVFVGGTSESPFIDYYSQPGYEEADYVFKS